jgi:microcystin-dependent protein
VSSPYVGEIRLFAGNFAPAGWLLCQGQELPIADYDVLFNLIGTTYGGDGQNTFALPNLASRIPVHAGPGYTLGQTGGVEQVTLTTAQLPAHTHVAQGASATGTSASPANALWASGTYNAYSAQAPDAAMAPNAVAASGGNQPHDNMPPFLAINFIIATQGIFPSQT